ncbi:MAG: hypothetical protein VKO64_00175 [Candidatus Sericytochromatia bacterium]|nr:hypothetical protein [Candidatus Sericytochromatia bacterium]
MFLGGLRGTGPLIDGKYRPGVPKAPEPTGDAAVPANVGGAPRQAPADRLERTAPRKHADKDKALDSLSEEQRDKYRTIDRYITDLSKIDHPDAARNAGALRAMLEQLLLDGKLDDKSSVGTTILDEMKKVLGGSARTLQGNIGDWRALADETGMTPKALVLQAVLEHLTDPRSIYQGDNTLTCGATTVQSMLAESKPAEYARIVCQLLNEGSVITAGGDLMSAEIGGLADGEDRRSHVEDLLQESFMMLAQQLPVDSVASAEDLARFGNVRSGGPGRGRVGAGDGAEGEGGLTGLQFIALANSMLNGQSKVAVINDPSTPKQDRSPDETLRLLKKALESGPVPIGVSVPGQDTGHALLLESISGPNAVLRDPNSPDGKVKIVPVAQLVRDLMFASVPADQAVRSLPTSSEFGDVGGGRYRSPSRPG